MASLNPLYCHQVADYDYYPVRYTGSLPHTLHYSETSSVPIYSYSKPPELCEPIHPAYYRGGVLDRPFWDANVNVQSPVGHLERWSGHECRLEHPTIVESDAALQLPRFDIFGNPLPRRYGLSSVIRSLNGLPITVEAHAGISANPPPVWVLEAMALRHTFLHCYEFNLFPVHAFIDCQDLYDQICGPWVTWRNTEDPYMVLVDELHSMWSALRAAKTTLMVVPRERLFLADYGTRLAPVDGVWYNIPDIWSHTTGRFFSWMDVVGKGYIWYPRIAY